MDMESFNSYSVKTLPDKNPIQKELMMSMLAMIEEMKEMQAIEQKAHELFNEVQLYSDKISDIEKKYGLDKLNELGFTSATCSGKDNDLIKKYTQIRERLNEQFYKYSYLYFSMEKRMNFIVRMKKYWGEDILLVPLNDFEKVCNKYNLTCGLFEEYTGHVPTDKIGKIAEIQRKINEMNFYMVNHDSKIKKLYRIINAKLWSIPDSRKTPYLRKCVDRVNSIFPFAEYDKDMNNGGLELSEGTYLFICAPKKYMRGAPKPKINYTDPFICAYTDYGIMILEKWDLEAEDDIIKSHEQKQSSFVNGVKSLFKWLSEP
jgi:hypothetical protein